MIHSTLPPQRSEIPPRSAPSNRSPSLPSQRLPIRSPLRSPPLRSATLASAVQCAATPGSPLRSTPPCPAPRSALRSPPRAPPRSPRSRPRSKPRSQQPPRSAPPLSAPPLSAPPLAAPLRTPLTPGAADERPCDVDMSEPMAAPFGTRKLAGTAPVLPSSSVGQQEPGQPLAPSPEQNASSANRGCGTSRGERNLAPPWLCALGWPR
mmetsp:Transcript_38011/g.88963  ORF Transcript_38011/g.88963 Transcript_38011/m.88963 type:complete len:208 (-) Transcript_38011:361-984(-)